jgi:hypothetical protein
MSWKAPSRAIRGVIHDEDGGVHQYSRDEDDSSEAIWRAGPPDELSAAPSDGPSITTAELLDALTTSLQAPYVPPD